MQRRFELWSYQYDSDIVISEQIDDGRELARLILQMEKNRIQMNLAQKKADILASVIEANRLSDKRPDKKKSSN